MVCGGGGYGGGGGGGCGDGGWVASFLLPLPLHSLKYPISIPVVVERAASG